MREVAAEFKDLRLYGMSSAWDELVAQGHFAGLQSARWLVEHLLDMEHTNRALRSIRYQLHSAKFPVHCGLAALDIVRQAPTPKAEIPSGAGRCRGVPGASSRGKAAS
jgi:hypothetical protein